MSVSIRLSRGGRKKQPFYHVVVADSRKSRNGKFIEKLGFYNPFAKEHEVGFKWNADRVNYWLEQGAQPSERVSKWVIAEKLGNDKVRTRLQTKLDVRRKAVEARLAKEKAAKDAEEKAATTEATDETAAE